MNNFSLIEVMVIMTSIFHLNENKIVLIVLKTTHLDLPHERTLESGRQEDVVKVHGPGITFIL